MLPALCIVHKHKTQQGARNLNRKRITQFLLLLVVQTLALIAVSVLPGITVHTLWGAVALVIAVALIQSLIWWFFIEFFARLPTIFYPFLTFILTGAMVLFFGNLLPGIEINNIWWALTITIILTVVNAVMSSLLAIDEDTAFDRNVTQRMVKKYGAPEPSRVPGFLYLEIDGLSIDILRRAVANGSMPTLKRWLDSGSHKLLQWETDYTSQTGAMQSGILLGSNDNVPAYRWWDRTLGKIIMSGDPRDAAQVEARLSNGKGLLSDGGASRGNMFSGDATESLFTMSSLLNPARGTGPGFYFYLINPFVVARLLTRFFLDIFREWIEAFRQRWRVRRGSKEYHVSARNTAYAFLRSSMGPLLQDMTTYTVISDLLRGVPAIYALYAGYDDLGHFAGMQSREAFEALRETDRYFARIEHSLALAPRPYHTIVLSDHGQSQGPTFESAYGESLETLVKRLADGQVYAASDTNEAQDTLNAALQESVQDNSRTARVVRRLLASRTQDGVVRMGSARSSQTTRQEHDAAQRANVVVLASGSAGLIYLADAKARVSFEQLQSAHPRLISGLVAHPGIGFVLVKSERRGTIAIGRGGINFVDEGLVEGQDPLASFGPNAARHLVRESSFPDCPDLIVNTCFDPLTQELAGFENQVSHHGGLGGPQNRPFLLYPAVLEYNGEPVVWATGVYKLLRGWRVQAQNLEPNTILQTP